MSLLGGGGVQQPTGPQSRFVEGLLKRVGTMVVARGGGGGHNNARGHTLGL